MTIEMLITRLLEAESPQRQFDGDIAEILGWTKRAHPMSGPDGVTSVRTTWYLPHSEDIGRVPFYTTDLQAAHQLFEQLCPKRHAGVAWGGGYGSARVLGGAQIERAATPAMSLCAVALREYQTSRSR